MTKTILVIDDEKLIGWSLKENLSQCGYKVLVSETAQESLRMISESEVDLILCDLRLPDMDGIALLQEIKNRQPEIPVIIITAYSDIATAVESIKKGAANYLVKPIDTQLLRIEIAKALESLTIKREIKSIHRRRSKRYNFGSIIAESPGMKGMIEQARKISPTPSSTVLITGESGVGKDLLARVIHYEGPRCENPFIEISCATIPETLLESELFGHEKGSFTDAKMQKKGLLELADGGTVFLNEIGHINKSLQVKLLRFIEEKSFKRLGGNEEILMDARVIAATNADLKKQVVSGEFREDLYYRLNVIAVHIPPLREHVEDVLPLFMHFLNRYAREMRRTVPKIGPEVEDILKRCPWQGNVRQVRNLAERLIILISKDEIEPVDLPPEIVHAGDPALKSMSINEQGLSLRDAEEDLIREAMKESEGNQVKAAKMLKISRFALRNRLKKIGLLK